MNKNKLLKTKFRLASILCITFYAFSIQKTYAEQIGISLDPPIIQIESKAPAIVNNPISIQNNSDQTMTYGIFLMPFKQSETKNGETEFDKTLIETYREFFKRVQVSDENRIISEITLGPKQEKQVNLRIAVTKEIPERDYYFSVLFITKEQNGSNENSFVGARAGIASNVLISIGNKEKSSGYIKKFIVPYFVTHGPIDFELTLANTSSHFVTIDGNLVIKNIFGQTVGNINLVPVNILGKSERIIESENNKLETPRLFWEENFLLGVYQADLTASLSEEGPILRRRITFIAIPLELILGSLVALILVIGIIRRIKHKQLE